MGNGEMGNGEMGNGHVDPHPVGLLAVGYHCQCTPSTSRPTSKQSYT